jgi:succinate-acetate transporter protein
LRANELDGDALLGSARIVLRPIGSPLPLGFVALGAGSVTLSGSQIGWLPITDSHQVGLVLLVFVAPLQLLSSVFGFLARDSVGGTGLGILAGSWLVIGSITITSPAGSTSRVLGLVLCFVSAGLLVPIVAAALGKVLAALVMFGAALRFALTGIAEITGFLGWEHTSGWWGIGLALLALYAAFAFEIEDTRRRTVLPTGRHGAGLAALNGTLGDNLERVVHEAGVREQL